MSTAIITGASGFLGKYLIRHLREHYPQMSRIALCLDPIRIEGAETRVCDLTRFDQIEKALQGLEPDWVFHLAGTARVSADVGMAEYFATNFLTTVGLLRALEKSAKTVRFFLSSSVHVYGNREGEVDENSVPQPLGDYGFTKYLAEEALRHEVRSRNNLTAVVGRLYSCIGPAQPAGFVASDLVRRLVDLPPGATLRTGPLEAFRRFIDVRDAVALFPQLLNWDSPERFEIVNIASPHEKTIRQVVQLLLQVSSKTVRIESSPSKDANPFLGLKLSLEKLGRIVPAMTFRPLEETLRDMWITQRG